MHSFYLDAIRNFEGFNPQAQWDYAQFSNGYGTKARYAGEVIDRAEADRRFHAEVSSARSIVEKAVPDLDEGTKAALTSLTYNAGPSWIESGLGDAVRRGDLDSARDIFLKYNKAGGEVLPGLVSRRAQEALWIGGGETAPASPAAGADPAALPPVVVERQHIAAQVIEAIRNRAPVVPAAAASTGPQDNPAVVVERAAASGALGNVTSDALVALIEADRLGPGGISDFARLAQLGRGSELARSDKDRPGEQTRRI
jgi:lysozyme